MKKAYVFVQGTTYETRVDEAHLRPTAVTEQEGVVMIFTKGLRGIFQVASIDNLSGFLIKAKGTLAASISQLIKLNANRPFCSSLYSHGQCSGLFPGHGTDRRCSGITFRYTRMPCARWYPNCLPKHRTTYSCGLSLERASPIQPWTASTA